MKLTINQIENIACGAIKIKETDGKFRLVRFTDEQMRLYEYGDRSVFFTRASCSSGAKFVFETDSKSLTLKGITSYGTSRKYYTIDVLVNGVFFGRIDNVFGAEVIDNIAENYELGEFSKSFELGDGVKKVEIYMPFSVVVDFEEISIDDGAYVKGIKSKYKGILLGDSITQGYDSLHPSNHYSVALSKCLDVDFVNKAIGGEIFFPKLAQNKDYFEPDYIFVAYGTNDWSKVDQLDTFKNNCRDFYCALSENYPSAKIFAISPIWRKDCERDTAVGAFESVAKIIEDFTKDLPNVCFINGVDFIPHDTSFFADYGLHPNDAGFSHYGKNLCEKVKSLLK